VRLYFDANIFIHAFECETDAGHAARRAFLLVEDGKVEGITSQLTLAEVLPRPYRDKDAKLEQAYEDVFAGRTGLTVHPVSLAVLRLSARLNADAGLRLPDAVHAATAIEASCDSLLTEDRRFRVPPGLVLRDLSDELFR
jgi:predicted nucleic acid-binding protein